LGLRPTNGAVLFEDSSGRVLDDDLFDLVRQQDSIPRLNPKKGVS
jgi:hypothetical protein